MLDLHIRPHFGSHLKVADVRFEQSRCAAPQTHKAGSSYMANRCLAVLSKMFSLAVRWRMRDDNPARGVEKNYEAKRKRYLSPDELARLSAALAGYLDGRIQSFSTFAPLAFATISKLPLPILHRSIAIHMEGSPSETLTRFDPKTCRACLRRTRVSGLPGTAGEEILQIGQDEKHRALELLAQHVDMMTTGKAAPGKVVQLRT
jgi:hypothetical protein